MIYYSRDTEKLINKLGNDYVFKCRESYTGIRFEMSNYEILLANSNINRDFSITGIMNIKQVLEAFKVSIDEIAACPEDILKHGWNWRCFEGWECSSIDFFVTIVDNYDDILLNVEYFSTPCFGCYSCEDTLGEVACEVWQSGHTPNDMLVWDEYVNEYPDPKSFFA